MNDDDHDQVVVPFTNEYDTSIVQEKSHRRRKSSFQRERSRAHSDGDYDYVDGKRDKKKNNRKSTRSDTDKMDDLVGDDSDSGIDSSKSSSFFRLSHKSWRLSARRRRRGSSTGSTGGGGVSGGLDPAFVEDIKKSILEYSRIIKQRRGIGTGLYQTPDNIHEWGQKQKEHHVNWADLFFDLIVVGSVFQFGILLSDVLDTEQYIGLWYYYAQFYVLYECWSLKLHFACRFHSSDIAHKVFDILEALIVALMAGHISTSVSGIEDIHNGQLIGFCLAKLTHQTMHMLRWVELYLFTEKKNVRNHAYFYLLELGVGTFPLISAVVLSIYRFPASSVIACLFSASMIQIGHEILRAINLGIRKKLETNSVPLHIEYCTHRYGEFLMLTLGEGVMQIILVEFKSEVKRYAAFVPAYLILAALRVLYYSSQPFKAQGHALNQSIQRGYIWLLVQPLESALIVCVGIGLKEALKKQDQFYDPKYIRYPWFLCISMCCLLVLIWTSSIIHQGFRKEFIEISDQIKNFKVFAYFWKYLLSLALLSLPVFHLESYSTLWIVLLVCILQIVTHDIWHRISKENEADTSYLKSLGLIETPNIVEEAKNIISHEYGGGGGGSNKKLLATTKVDDSSKKEGPDEDDDGVSHTQSMPAKVPNHHRSSIVKEKRETPAPYNILLQHKKKMEDSMRSRFRFGRFETADADDGDQTNQILMNGNDDNNKRLKQDIIHLFHKYNADQVEQGLKYLMKESKIRRESSSKENCEDCNNSS